MSVTLRNKPFDSLPSPGCNMPRTCYQRVKGLFPFKGKGGLLRYMGEIEVYAQHLEQAAHDLAQQYNSLLKVYRIVLTPHTESKRGDRVPMVRWRSVGSRSMGIAQFDQMMRKVPSEGERQMLFDIEVQRCLINNQAGTVNATMRRLRTTLESLEHAEDLLGAGSVNNGG